MKKRPATNDVDQYISGFPPDVQKILQEIRSIIRKALPNAGEAIKYGIPTFVQNGNVVHFAAFKQHIGMYPPVKGDAKLNQQLAPYANEKGNLSFPLDEPMPYPLIRKVVKQLIAQHEQRKAAKRG